MTTDATAAHVALRERLMVAAMAHVIFDGWTWRAIEAGANDLGLDAVEAPAPQRAMDWPHRGPSFCCGLPYQLFEPLPPRFPEP